MNKVQLKSIVKIVDALPYLLTRIFVGITPTEKIYIVLPFINVRKIIRGTKNFVFINPFTDHVGNSRYDEAEDQTETTTTISITSTCRRWHSWNHDRIRYRFPVPTEWIKLYPHIFPTGAVHALWIKLKMGIFNWTDNKWNQIQYFLKAIISRFVYNAKNPLTIVRGFFYFFTFRNTKCTTEITVLV